MKYIKLALISLIVFAVLLTLVSFFFPSTVRISKAVDITAPKDSLLSLLGDADRWDEWYPGLDTLEKVQLLRKTIGYRVTPEGAMLRRTGFSDTAISSEISGAGIRNTKGGWNIFPAAVPNTFTVQWYQDFRLKWYPWEQFSSITFEKRYGPLLERGLENLKRALSR